MLFIKAFIKWLDDGVKQNMLTQGLEINLETSDLGLNLCDMYLGTENLK